MRDLLQLPPLRGGGSTLPETKRECGAELFRQLRAAVDRLPATPGEDLAAALADTLGTRRDDHLQTFAERVIARPGRGAAPQIFYACAAEAVAEGELGLASVGLVVLLENAAIRSAALLGLAVCAARADKPDEALAMALSSRQGDDAFHPRAFSIAGVAEHLRGHAAQARLYLALASRLARGNAEYAPDLRLAQQLLLAMHMA